LLPIRSTRFASALAASLCILALSRATATPTGKIVLHVGIDKGDLRGDDQRALQAAVDYVANLGGGTVLIGPGKYSMRNALQLRNGVHIRGTPGKTLLIQAAGRKTALVHDVLKKESHIKLADPTGFDVGDGIFLQDKAGHGFEVTTATLIKRLDPKTFLLSCPAESDYLRAREAEVKLSFPLVGGSKIKDAAVEDLILEGNYRGENSQYLGGCRGGGIYLIGCENVAIRRCSVRRYNGDAISFQGKSHHLTIEECVAEHNANVGMHPGSGSHSCIVRRNVLKDNGYVGLFVCVGVKNVLFEDNDITDNGGCGISIGYGDTDNIFRKNRVVGNAEMAVLFRRDSPEHGGHRNVFEKNLFQDNLGPRPDKSNSRPSSAGKAAVVIEGAHHDLVFCDNQFIFSKPHAGPGVLRDAVSKGLVLKGNVFKNVAAEVEVYAGAD